MIISFEDFRADLERTIHKDMKSSLLMKLSKEPNRYVGLFRLSDPELKLIQNITQSREILFGDFMESIVTRYLSTKYKNLSKHRSDENGSRRFDQLFQDDQKIIFVEQKVRDDHDSTKKRGQFSNFKDKLNYLEDTFSNIEIEGIMWFIDDSFTKNKSYYSREIAKLNSENGHKTDLIYGSLFFEKLDMPEVWSEICSHIARWKRDHSRNISLNFEENWEETKKELTSNITKRNWNLLITNKLIVTEIFPTLSPEGKLSTLNEEDFPASIENN